MILYSEPGWSIFTIARSRHLQVRATVKGKTHIKSTGTGDIETAKAFARRFYRDLHPLDQKPLAVTFEEAALDVIRYDEARVRRGERNRHFNDGQNLPLNNHLIPFLGRVEVKRVDYATLERLIEHLSDKGLRTASIRRYMVFVGKTLRYAFRTGAIDRIPEIPRIKGKTRSRAWFSPDEYKLLLRTIHHMELEGTKIRTQRVGFELRSLVIFLTTTFLRPGDFKQLRHHHDDRPRVARNLSPQCQCHHRQHQLRHHHGSLRRDLCRRQRRYALKHGHHHRGRTLLRHLRDQLR